LLICFNFFISQIKVASVALEFSFSKQNFPTIEIIFFSSLSASVLKVYFGFLSLVLAEIDVGLGVALHSEVVCVLRWNKNGAEAKAR
jgi:hypothetical protein